MLLFLSEIHNESPLTELFCPVPGGNAIYSVLKFSNAACKIISSVLIDLEPLQHYYIAMWLLSLAGNVHA